MECLEQSLAQVSQESSERADQLEHTKRESGKQLEALQQQLASVESERQRERGELRDQLETLSASLSQSQQELQSREKVTSQTLEHEILIGRVTSEGFQQSKHCILRE